MSAGNGADRGEIHMGFLQWWEVANFVLQSRGLAEMLYGEVKGYYQEWQLRRVR